MYGLRRHRKIHEEVFATERMKKSPIHYMRSLLNDHDDLPERPPRQDDNQDLMLQSGDL